MTEYKLSELGITEQELFDGLNYLYPQTYSYRIDLDNNDIIYFLGSNSDPNAPIPNVQTLIQGAADYRNLQTTINNEPLQIPSTITTSDNSFTFVTSVEGNACVSILTGSNSIASVLDSTKMENLVQVNNDVYIDSVSNLPIYKYNIVSQNTSNLRIGPLGSDWNNVFNFSEKDPTLTNVELMDTIGVLLTCVQNLNQRVKQLENASNPV